QRGALRPPNPPRPQCPQRPNRLGLSQFALQLQTTHGGRAAGLGDCRERQVRRRPGIAVRAEWYCGRVTNEQAAAMERLKRGFWELRQASSKEEIIRALKKIGVPDEQIPAWAAGRKRASST